MQIHPLKIISLNIQMDRHFDRIIDFFRAQQPDVILLQEVLGKDTVFLEEATGMSSIYTTQNIIHSEQFETTLGLMMLSNLPMTNHQHIVYSGNGSEPVPMTISEPEKTVRIITTSEIKKNQCSYCLANTHFTWTPNAQPSQVQREDLKRLLTHLDTIPEFILCGDFNTPRGTEIFDIFASKYKDNIPGYITTTIDKNLHRAGDLGIVVDGLFTTPGYEVIDIHVQDNVSDHYGIVATIECMHYEH